MATELTNFYECGKDVADVYIGRDEIEYQVLTNVFDTNRLSEVGFDEITCNTIWGWGTNALCTLGQSYTSSYLSPIITNQTNCEWDYVSSGFNHVTAIKADGTLWSWGSGGNGGFGNESTSDTRTPTQEITSSTWSYVAGGEEFTTAIKTDGSLWSWGFNGNGELGIDTVSNTSSPVQEITSSTWILTENGSNHALALKNDNTLWAWGCNNSGRLGDGTAGTTTEQRSSPVQEVSSSSNWCLLAASSSFSAATKTDGTLWAWGINNSGQLGDGTTVFRSSPVQEASSSSNWCSIGVSGLSLHGIKTDGTLWSAGAGACGHLADSTIIDKSSPIQEVTSSTNWAILSKSGGDVRVSAAIKNDGTLWSWGRGTSGRLGIGDEFNRSSPVQESKCIDSWIYVSVGNAFSVALKR